MPKYLIEFNYTAEGTRGLIKEGGSKRRDAVVQLVKGLGGKLEAFYYCFGEYDGVAIVDAPEAISEMAASLIISASGAVKLKTTVLLTPEEMDQAAKKTVDYRPPGQ
jgi:uncharacterized protein with GYD domain